MGDNLWSCIIVKDRKDPGLRGRDGYKRESVRGKTKK